MASGISWVIEALCHIRLSWSGYFGTVPVSLGSGNPIRLETAVLATGLTAQILYVIASTDIFGGVSYGERYLIIIVPLLLYYLSFALPGVPKHRDQGATRRSCIATRAVQPAIGTVSLGLLAIAAVLSGISAAQGANNAWKGSRPPLSLYARPEAPYLGVRSRLSFDLRQGPFGWVTCPCCKSRELPALTKRSAIGHQVAASFEDKLMLLGYDLPTRRVRAGGSMPITVYWQVLSPVQENYMQSSQLLGERLTRMGGVDRPPLDSDTACWEPGEILVDKYDVPVFAQAPDGTYQLLIGLYSGQADNATYLRLAHAGQPTDTANVTIGPIKVGGAPPGSTLTEASPQHSQSTLWGGVIRLLGYDSSVNKGATPDEMTLHLKFYWQSAAQTDIDYSVFVHLLDASGNIVGQKDHLLGRYDVANSTAVESPPAERWYPTSVWDPGEVIADEIVLSLPAHVANGSANKKWSLEVGLYDLATGERLAVPEWPDGAIRLAEMK